MSVSLLEKIVSKIPGGRQFLGEQVDSNRRNFVKYGTYTALALGLTACSRIGQEYVTKATSTPTRPAESPSGINDRPDKKNSPGYFLFATVIEKTQTPTQENITETKQMCPISWGENSAFKTTWNYKGVNYKIRVKKNIIDEIIITVDGKKPEEVLPEGVRMWVDEKCGMLEVKNVTP